MENVCVNDGCIRGLGLAFFQPLTASEESDDSYNVVLPRLSTMDGYDLWFVTCCWWIHRLEYIPFGFYIILRI